MVQMFNVFDKFVAQGQTQIMKVIDNYLQSNK